MSQLTSVGRAQRLVDRASRYLDGEDWRPIAALFALNAVDEFDNQVFSVLGPEIADAFGLSLTQFGSLGILTAVLAPLVAVPVSYLADRWKRIPLAVGGAVIWAAASLVTGLAPVVSILIAARMVSGSGKVVNEPVHSALIADFYSPGVRAKAYGLHQLANPIGAFLAAVLAGLLGQYFGWRVPFLAATLPTLALLLLVRRLREPERDRFEAVEHERTPPWRETVRTLWAIRTLRLAWIGGAFTFGAITALAQIAPFLFRDEFGASPGTRGLVSAIGTAVGAVAVVVGTAFIQRHLRSSPSQGLRWLSMSGMVAGGSLLVIGLSPALWLAAVAMWVTVGVFAFVVPGLRAITALVSPPEMRSTAFAMSGLVGLGGIGFAVIGFAIGDLSQRAAFVVMTPVFLRGVGYFFQAAKHLDDDVARLDPARRAAAAVGDHGAGMLLETAGVTVHYGNVQVLFGVDLEIRRGEIVALLGTNGAGKSTTLNAISGLHPPSAGNVWFEGQPITGELPERTVLRGIVQVPGGRGVFPGLSVEENLRMGAFTFRSNSSEVATRLRDVEELFPRLRERRSQLAGSLSGGERQMLTLAQSFLLRPKLLMIDELSLGLAPAIVSELLDAVRGMNERGATVIVVEQSVNVALTLAERAYFMEKGEVRFSGPTADLLERQDLLRSVFLEGARSVQ